MRTFLPQLLLVASCCALADAGAAVLIDFNSASDLDDFRERGGGSPAAYTWTGTKGIGSPLGAVTSANTGTTLAQNLYYTAETYNPVAGGDPLRVSVFMLARANTGTGDSRNFLGFAAGTNVNLSTDNGKLGVRLFKSAASSQYLFQLQNGTSVLNLGTAFDLVQDHWYRATVEITRTGAGTFLMTGELLDYGITGTDLDPVFSRSGSTSSTNSSMGTAWNVGLLNQLNNGGVTSFDNLSINAVPEPRPLFFLVAAGLYAILFRRRFSRL